MYYDIYFFFKNNQINNYIIYITVFKMQGCSNSNSIFKSFDGSRRVKF